MPSARKPARVSQRPYPPWDKTMCVGLWLVLVSSESPAGKFASRLISQPTYFTIAARVVTTATTATVNAISRKAVDAAPSIGHTPSVPRTNAVTSSAHPIHEKNASLIARPDPMIPVVSDR